MILILGSFILQLHGREKLFKECNERIWFINYKVIKPYSIWYMQMTKNMIEACKSVYIMVIFLSVFLLSTNIDGKPI